MSDELNVFPNVIDLGNGSLITPSAAQSKLNEINGRGEFIAFVAQIFGPHDTKRFMRNFMPPDWALSRHRKRGFVVFYLNGPGLYEFNRFCVNDDLVGWHRGGFFICITGHGILEISVENATKIAQEMKVTSWEDIERKILKAIYPLTDSIKFIS